MAVRQPASAYANANAPSLAANIEFDRGPTETFASRPELHVELSVEFLDAPKFSGEAFSRTMATCRREEYAAHSPEVIIAGSDEALDFVLRCRAPLFPGAPVVFQSIGRGLATRHRTGSGPRSWPGNRRESQPGRALRCNGPPLRCKTLPLPDAARLPLTFMMRGTAPNHERLPH